MMLACKECGALRTVAGICWRAGPDPATLCKRCRDELEAARAEDAREQEASGMTIEELISYTEFLAHADGIDHINPEQSRCVAALLRELVAYRAMDEAEHHPHCDNKPPIAYAQTNGCERCGKLTDDVARARLASDAAMAGQPAGGGAQ